ncbi:MAG TPA: nuclear transport factor 2 family protein [Acidimicrobiales bacterium]|nr:nuclear transport factor 2 family protein [Acidimicrobiales bacterium]
MTTEQLTLEERVQRLEDLQAIARLFRDYRRFLDGKDFVSYSQLFAADAEFTGSDGGGTGPEAIRSMVEGMVGTHLRTKKGDDLHLVANEIVEVHGDRAVADVTWIYIVRADDGTPSMQKVGHYHDILVRKPDGWRFQRREGTTDIFE